jgi:polyisoprenoid-binding protein YceI
MKKYFILALFILFPVLIYAQAFNIKGNNNQNFVFNDKIIGNQIQFSSSTPLENINGTAGNISGSVSFDPSNFEKTLKGNLSVPVKSINTGIELRNKHLQSSNWLNEPKYPMITFEVKSVSELKQISENKLSFKVIGSFTMHGVTKEITADAEAIYLKENDQTAKRAPGDLLGITANFLLQLSDFKVDNSLIGNKVAENIILKILIVGSNKI